MAEDRTDGAHRSDGVDGPMGPVLRDAAALDALALGATAAGGPAPDSPLDDPALALLAGLRAAVDDQLAALGDPAVRRDGLLLDLVARGAPVAAGTDAAAALLAALRSDVDAVPAQVGRSLPVARLVPAPVAAKGAGRGRTFRRRRRVVRTGAAVLAVAGAMSTSGVAAAAYSSHPGAPLYSLRTHVFGRTPDDPEVPRQLIARAQREYALAEQSPASADSERHVAAGEALLASARGLLPRLPNPAVQVGLASSASTVQTALAKVPAPPASSRRAPTAPSARPAGTAVALGSPSVPAATATAAVPSPPAAVATSGGAALPGAEATAGASATPGPSASVDAAGGPATPSAGTSPDGPTPTPVTTDTPGSSTPEPSPTPSLPPTPTPSTSASPGGPAPTSPRPSATPTRTPGARPSSARPSAKATRPPTPRPRHTLEPVSMVTPGVDARPNR